MERAERGRERQTSVSEMTGMPRKFTFSHNGQEMEAVLVDDPPAGDSWTMEELCSICNEPLAHFSFYTTDPPLFYIHSHCAYTSAALLPPPAAAAAPSSGSQARNLPHYSIPSAPLPPPPCIPSYPPNYYSFPYHYHQHQQASNYYYPSMPYYVSNPYHPFPAYSANYYPPNTAAAPGPSSSVSGWVGTAATTVVGSFMQALFSLLLS